MEAEWPSGLDRWTSDRVVLGSNPAARPYRPFPANKRHKFTIDDTNTVDSKSEIKLFNLLLPI